MSKSLQQIGFSQYVWNYKIFNPCFVFHLQHAKMMIKLMRECCNFSHSARLTALRIRITLERHLQDNHSSEESIDSSVVTESTAMSWRMVFFDVADKFPDMKNFNDVWLPDENNFRDGKSRPNQYTCSWWILYYDSLACYNSCKTSMSTFIIASVMLLSTEHETFWDY